MVNYLSYKDILEYIPGNLNLNFTDEKLFRTIFNFINCRDIDTEKNNILVSLSGGVDSMVVITALLKIFPPNNIVAAHINYNNREESIREQLFLEEWCRENRLNIHVKSIEDLRRGIDKREEYEEQSRKIRFDLYKELMSKYNIDFVIFGHHRDDLSENVFTNVMNGRSLLDLSVILPESEVMGVNVFRPLVPHPKKDIFEFSHKYQIPYFKDTTPSWSNRGVLRKQLFPKFTERYGSGFTQNLVKIGNSSQEWGELIQSKILKPFIDNSYNSKIGYIFNISNYKGYPYSFWDQVFLHVFHSMGLSMISGKSLSNLISKINSSDNCSITLKKECISYIYNNELVIINKNIISPIIDIRHKICINSTLNFENISITNTIIDKIGKETNTTSKNIIDGEIKYYIPYIDDEYHDLIIINSHSKKTYLGKQFKDLNLLVFNAMPKVYYKNVNEKNITKYTSKYIEICIKFN